MNWRGKKVLVSGSEGMIGKELVEQLKELGADLLCADIKESEGIFDLTYYHNCEGMIRNYEPDFVFHLAGIKGSPKMTQEKPVDFMAPMLQFDTNMILASQIYGVKRFLYTSSIAVLNPESDKYPAWAKQTAEKLIEAMRIQYPEGTKYCVVRPANVYGRFDNFKNPNAMVITSLISKTRTNNKSFEVWGDGTPIRDFINAKDVARAMILVMENMPDNPINVGSGKATSIREIANIIGEITNKTPIFGKQGITGAKTKLMNLDELNKLGFKPEVNIKDGIKEAIEYATTKSGNSNSN